MNLKRARRGIWESLKGGEGSEKFVIIISKLKKVKRKKYCLTKVT